MRCLSLAEGAVPVSYTHLFDETALGNVQPLYPDTVDYGPLENNAEFLIYEGANVVGLSLIHIWHEYPVPAGSPVPLPRHGPQLGGEPRLQYGIVHSGT